MSNGISTARRLLVIGHALLSALLLGGCGDMPIIEEGEERAVEPRIMLGPYLVEEPNGRLSMRFDTDRRCVAGVRLLTAGNRVERFAAFNTSHRIPMPTPARGRITQGQILLDNVVGADFKLGAPPQPGEAATIVFVGGAAQPAVLALLASRLRDTLPAAVLFCQSPLGPGAQLATWRESFLRPLSSLACRAPFYFPPGSSRHVPGALYPVVTDSLWSKNFGCVHVVALDAAALLRPARRRRLLARLEADLRDKPESVPWTVVMLPLPLFGAVNVNARLLQALGDRFERWGVNLVVSGGAPYYHRTIPLRLSHPGKVRYVTTGGLGVQQSPGRGREYTAVLAAVPHACLLTADQGMLHWQVLAGGGRIIDDLVLQVDGTSAPAETALDKQEILTTALSTLAQRHEAAAIARQVCRALPDPDAERTLSLRLENRSTRVFAGNLHMAIPAGSRWRVRPLARGFKLQPGQVGWARFRLVPARDQAPSLAPLFTVDAGAVGYTRQRLILTREKRLQVPRVRGACTVDGFFNDPLWKRARELKGFSETITGRAPTQPLRCWLAAGAQGLYVAFHCLERGLRGERVRAREHDDFLRADEGVALLLDPSRRARSFLEFGVNCKGVAMERSSLLGVAWSPAWKHAVQQGRDDKGRSYYDVEMLIPWRALGLRGPPRAGSAWSLNLLRNDTRTGGKNGPAASRPEIVEWCPTRGNRTLSGLYGLVIFQ